VARALPMETETVAVTEDEVEFGQKKARADCRVPIVEVTKESASDTWSALNEAINAASYIALDLVSASTHRKLWGGEDYILLQTRE